MNVVVVGAGLAGLTAATQLQAAGATVVVLEKSGGPGGRLATRRIGSATLDHGAQFFTVRSPAFAERVARWTAEGCPIRVWADGFAQAPDVRGGPQTVNTGGDGHPRYVVDGGMNRLAKHLATGLDVRCGTLVRALTPDAGRWRLRTSGGEAMDAEAVVCTAPVPQTLALLASARTPLSGLDALRRVRFEPCLAVLAVLDRSPRLPGPGGVQLTDGPVRWLGDNAAKGVSEIAALTIHAAGDTSVQRYDDADEVVVAALLGLVAPWLGAARVVDAQVKRWRYSRPVLGVEQPCAGLDVDGARLVIAGDAFAGAKVEGAALSGLAAAAALAEPSTSAA